MLCVSCAGLLALPSFGAGAESEFLLTDGTQPILARDEHEVDFHSDPLLSGWWLIA